MNRTVSYADVARAAALLEDEATTRAKAIGLARDVRLRARLRFLERVLGHRPTGDAKLDRAVFAMQRDEGFLWILVLAFGPMPVAGAILGIVLPCVAIAREVTERELGITNRPHASFSKMAIAWLVASAIGATVLSGRGLPVGLSMLAVGFVWIVVSASAAARGEWRRR